ncbi:MAG: hypothetical protein KAT77_02195 [Nanoarchaeota archaeon]|nr:hypothetical protein [Nanoarchaeota archaeon]
MVNPQLINYIKNQLTKGYNINSIKLNLARTGYSPERIEEAVEAAYGRPKRNLTKILVLVGGGAVLLAGLITLLILLFSGTEEIGPTVPQVEEKSVSLDVLLEADVIKPGEDLSFDVKTINTGSGSNFGVAVVAEVVDDDGSQIWKEEDIITLTVQERKSYEVDDLPEGDYQLKVTIDYAGKTKSKTVNFKVSEEEVDVEVNQLEVLTGEAIRRISDVEKVAERDPAEAKNLCLGMSSVLEKDTCLFKVGLKTDNEEFCVGITNDDKKDSCYVNLALSLRNYNLCNNIGDASLKDACLKLG